MRSSTSEVGSAEPIVKESAHKVAALEAQNLSLMDLIKSMKTPRIVADARPIHVTLPKFNPDYTGSDAAAWCTTAELILTENPLEGGSNH